MKILILCNLIANTAATVGDHISAFLKYSENKFETFNCIKNKLSLELLNNYDAVMIHYSILIEMDYYLSPINRYILSQYQGLKIIFLQDENRNVNKIVNCIKNLNIDLVFTVVPSREIQKVYSVNLLPGVIVTNVLTGYVQENLLHQDVPGYDKRLVDVVYRARKLSASFGRLCYEKYTIADKFNEDAKKYHLKVDISALETDRIYGQAWINFLLASKACLGVESGGSLFDYTGKIRAAVERHELLYPDTSFDELEKLYFQGLDYNVNYNQISPRHFEAAALKTLMILYEGEYSNILHPWQHYVPLKKDHSNIQDVIAVINNQSQWEEITSRAYQEIALNPLYSFKHFVEQFDSIVRAQKQSNLFSSSDIPCSLNLPKVMQSNCKQSILSYLLKFLNYIKITIRQVGAKIYWRLEKICADADSNKVEGVKYEFIKFFKNKIKLLGMHARDYDKANNKLLLIFSIFYYKRHFNKAAVHTEDKDLIFCLHDSTKPKIKPGFYNLLFKRIKICDNCRIFVGF
jgi:hypothetical protein